MKRLVLGLAAAAVLSALPAAAQAYYAQVAGAVNLRTCASTQCTVITVMSPGVTVNVIGGAGGWDYLTYGGVTGYAASGYIATAGYAPSYPPVVVRPPVVRSYPVYPYYPVFPVYPRHRNYYAQPGFSLSFGFRG